MTWLLFADKNSRQFDCGESTRKNEVSTKEFGVYGLSSLCPNPYFTSHPVNETQQIDGHYG
jgi:hypothetical protein